MIRIFNRESSYLLLLHGVYTWVIPSKDKKGTKITNTFHKNLNDFNNKWNELWVNKGSEFYIRSMKSFLKSNDVEMYSVHNKGKSVSERFIRILKNKIYKYMTSTSNGSNDNLEDIVNKCNKRYHNTTKMKPVNVKSSTYIASSKGNTEKYLNLKFVVLLHYQNIKIFLQNFCYIPK